MLSELPGQVAPVWAARPVSVPVLAAVSAVCGSRFVVDVNEERGTTIIMIEHDMGVVMDLSNRVTVLDFGEKIADGVPEEVRSRPEVQRAYLGEHQGMFDHRVQAPAAQDEREDREA